MVHPFDKSWLPVESMTRDFQHCKVNRRNDVYIKKSCCWVVGVPDVHLHRWSLHRNLVVRRNSTGRVVYHRLKKQMRKDHWNEQCLCHNLPVRWGNLACGQARSWKISNLKVKFCFNFIINKENHLKLYEGYQALPSEESSSSHSTSTVCDKMVRNASNKMKRSIVMSKCLTHDLKAGKVSTAAKARSLVIKEKHVLLCIILTTVLVYLLW